MGFSAKPLDATTWPGFAALVERHNGVWGGCWCMAFHAKGVGAAGNRAEKEARVREGHAHAALIFDGAACVGWCQFGPTQELPRIKHRRAYEEGLTSLPDWRITCFFSDKAYRGKGVAAAALAARSPRSPASAAARWKAIPRMRKAARSPAPSCTMARWRCLNAKVFSAPARSASIAGWSHGRWRPAAPDSV